MYAYFAHPIDHCEGDLTEELELIRKGLVSAGYMVYDPQGAFFVEAPFVADETAEKVNRFALARCNHVVAYLPEGEVTYGVPAEVEHAYWIGKPTLVIAEREVIDRSFTLKHWTTRQNFLVTDHFNDGIRWLTEQPLHRYEPIQELKWTGPGREPTRAYEGDAGFDLYAHIEEPVQLEPLQECVIPFGVAVQPPPYHWFLMAGRSSSFKHGLLVNQAIIDHGYRGPLFAGVRNVSGHTVEIEPGQRIAQLIPMPLQAEHLRLKQVAELDPSERGDRGFGSSGK